MATKKSTSTRKRAPARKKTPKKAAAKSRGIQPSDCLAQDSDASETAQRIKDGGGAVLTCYREPLGGNIVLLAALPIDTVEPTPFQRDLSDAHYKKLSGVIDKTGLFLDPIITITAPKDGFWTP